MISLALAYWIKIPWRLREIGGSYLCFFQYHLASRCVGIFDVT